MIEYWFPIESVGIEGKKEKTVAIGRIPSIAQYFARRPTCAVRAIILSSLLELPSDDSSLKDYFNLIQNYGLRNIPNKVKFDGKEIQIIQAIKAACLKQNIDTLNLKAFDPFAGGGTFPLELRNLGFQTFCSDLNPVAILIEKATCEYPQKYGNKLINVIEKYFLKVQKILEEKVGYLYKNDLHKDNNINFFVWARQIPCPECNLSIPLIKSFFLSKKYKWAIIPQIPKEYDKTEIKMDIGWPNEFKGFYQRGKVNCPRCKKTIPRDLVMKLVSENYNHRLLVIYEDYTESSSGPRGSFRLPTQKEIQNTSLNRNEIVDNILEKYPEIDIHFQEKVSAWGIQNYGLSSVLKCFNSRQLFLLKNILDIIHQLKTEIYEEFDEIEFSDAIMLYLSLGLLKMTDFNSTLTELIFSDSPKIGHTWTRPGLFMKGMPYVEGNSLRKTSGGWLKYLDSLKRVLKNLISQPKFRNGKISIKQMDVLDLEYDDESMDFCFTDPPYYDNVPYAASTDYFYAWLKAALDSTFPELFLSNSTPKDTELVQDSFRQGNTVKAKDYYERGMAKAFSEIYRVLKKEGIVVIIFAHKDTNAWETLLQAIIDSELVITNTWPLLMEVTSGIRAMNVVSLDSVILLVCRKTNRKTKTYYDENFRKEIGEIVKSKLDHHWRLGFRGADFFLSALGPAIGEFSQFESVLDIKTDESIKLRKYLDFIDEILVKFSLGKALGTEETSTDAQTQLYLVWRASYKLSKLHYDEVWKFTHTLGLDDKKLEGKLLKKVRIKSKIVYQCLDAIDKHKEFMEKNFSPSSLIEALQYASILWSENNDLLDDFIDQYLKKYGDEFWHVAQAIINLIPDAPESKLFIGLMRKYGKGVIKTSKDNKKDKENIQQTFVIEGNDIFLKNKISKKEKKSI